MCSTGDCVGCRYTSHAGAGWRSAADAPRGRYAEHSALEDEAEGKLEVPAAEPRAEHLESWLGDLLKEVEQMMHGRGAKYGPGNISEFGELGVLVRLSDKLSRLRHTTAEFGDETSRDSWLDVIGYGLIGLAWCDGLWPGSEREEPPST